MPLEMHQLKKVDDYRFLAPRGTRSGMQRGAAEADRCDHGVTAQNARLRIEE
jgi:hypothetical protein